MKYKRTLKKTVSYSGLGIHTGKSSLIRFVPQEHSGIQFVRTDLPSHPRIPAHVSFCAFCERSTTLGKEGVYIHTVEHVLAALKAYFIDHLLIEVTNVEPPIGDGSALPFVEMIEEAGILELEELKEDPFVLESPVFVEGPFGSLIALPYSGFKISYTLDYPNCPFIGTQFFSSDITEDIFKNEIAKSRTFSTYQEISSLLEAGLIRGGGLENALVALDNAVISHGGLRFQNEMVRHKVLDVIGDLSLMRQDILAHIVSLRSGHALNVALAKKIDQMQTSDILCQKY